jgi:hypothetical protein
MNALSPLKLIGCGAAAREILGVFGCDSVRGAGAAAVEPNLRSKKGRVSLSILADVDLTLSGPGALKFGLAAICAFAGFVRGLN